MGKLPYLEKYPTANSDSFTEDRRIELCRKGVEHAEVMDRDKMSFEFEGTNPTEKLKLYVAVGAKVFEEFGYIVEVLSAYKCPTSPPTFVHVLSLIHISEPTRPY